MFRAVKHSEVGRTASGRRMEVDNHPQPELFRTIQNLLQFNQFGIHPPEIFRDIPVCVVLAPVPDKLPADQGGSP